MSFYYSFPAVSGIQANREYYITMVPYALLEKLFINEDVTVSPEFRAQRRINEKRIPEIKNYIINNREDYVFSALAASIDGKFYFKPLSENIGTLEVSMDSKFLINDGQHRKAAIIESIKHDESLANESIPIVFFKDQGLVKSQQMFTDLNKHAVNTSKSLNTLYNSNDELAVVTKRIIKQIDFFETYTEKEKDTLGKFSQKLFMLNNFYNANRMLFGNLDVSENYDKALRFWNGVANNIVEWNQLEDKSIKKISLRRDFIVTQGVVIVAFGKLGNYFLTSKIVDYDKYLSKLQKVNWMRSNPIWEGKTLVNGKISRRDNHINLTYLQIKELLGIKLSEDELNYVMKNEGKKNE